MPTSFHDKEISTLAWILSLCITLLSYAAITSAPAFLVPCALFLLLASPMLSPFAAVAAITNLFLFIPFPTLGAYPFFTLLGTATVSLLCLNKLPSASRIWPQAQLRLLASRQRILACSVLLAASALLTAVPAFESLLWAAQFFLLGLALPKRAVKRNLNWINAGVLFVSLTLSAALLELGTRVVFEPIVPFRPVYEPHPQYIYTLVPGRKWTDRITATEGEPFAIESESSEQGINGSVVYGPKGDDEFRILMLGDSFAAGYGSPWKDTIGQALETLLAEESLVKRCVVINGGIGGYGPWQERGFLLERCLAFEPDLVIHQLFTANDVHDTLLQFGRRTEAYPIWWHRRMDNFRRQGLLRYRTHEWILRRSRVYQLLAKNLPGATLLHLPRRFRFLVLDTPHYPPSIARNWVMEVHLATWYPTLQEGWQAFEADVLSIESICKEREMDYFAYNIPLYVSLRDDLWKSQVALLEPGLEYVKLKDCIETEAFFVREGIPYVNVADALAAHPNQSEVFHHPNGHLKKAGSWIIAGELRDYLMSEYLPRKGLLKTDVSSAQR